MSNNAGETLDVLTEDEEETETEIETASIPEVASKIETTQTQTDFDENQPKLDTEQVSKLLLLQDVEDELEAALFAEIAKAKLENEGKERPECPEEKPADPCACASDIPSESPCQEATITQGPDGTWMLNAKLLGMTPIDYNSKMMEPAPENETNSENCMPQCGCSGCCAQLTTQQPEIRYYCPVRAPPATLHLQQRSCNCCHCNHYGVRNGKVTTAVMNPMDMFIGMQQYELVRQQHCPQRTPRDTRLCLQGIGHCPAQPPQPKHIARRWLTEYADKYRDQTKLMRTQAHNSCPCDACQQNACQPGPSHRHC